MAPDTPIGRAVGDMRLYRQGDPHLIPVWPLDPTTGQTVRESDWTDDEYQVLRLQPMPILLCLLCLLATICMSVC